jgi:FMN phosphatase YigB (HAD superfamily)
VRTVIDRYFGLLILSGECGIAKPARDIFGLACDSMGVSPSQAVYVGDRRFIDAEAARSVGVCIANGDRLRASDDSGPWRRIGSLSALPAAITVIEQNSRKYM